ncbi:GSU2403 family nucleotidyltransferase fold protein [Enorma phocaeensis]|uniref:Nucleotidyltransferase domain-containing protein n=1 Tax=Enorma phocaeensis TaxID=1871019 RepID=A0A921ITB5_9ACTN|nr:GSU2403 family nucleotidyltransferase fold protein [Enorma phocaeensis]HJG36688.1 nucleotidyltransferase domain-containing protein [Enorma phocaeensis]
MLNEQQRAFARILDLIEDAGCMPYVVLVGSWAEFVYQHSGILPRHDPNIRTMDVDFLVRNLRRPVPAANLAAYARNRGFLVESDVLNGTTKFFDVSGLEVEFLIGKVGAGVEPALKTNVGVTAQALRHMGILSRHVLEASCFGHIVRVPIPEAYAVHKMVINSQRGRKSEKDARAILEILPHLDKAQMGLVVSELTRKEKSRLSAFIDEHGITL